MWKTRFRDGMVVPGVTAGAATTEAGAATTEVGTIFIGGSQCRPTSFFIF